MVLKNNFNTNNSENELINKDNIRGRGSSISLKLMESFIQFLALKVKSLLMASRTPSL